MRSTTPVRSPEDEVRTCRDGIPDIAGRILAAQEAERARIAAELHDDILQQLALLEIELGQSGVSRDALDRLHEIGRSVRGLSHRLHPVKLQLLGIVASLRALAREQSRSGISVVFTHGELPRALSPALTSCLYRVAQEAVHNAVKHSQGRRISVDLRRDEAEVVLTITDDGVGFELERVWGKGLGFITIRERVEASGGTVAIRSRLGRGTRFDVRVPLTGEPAAFVASGQSAAPLPAAHRNHVLRNDS
jgi:signal transduction histidine kinase